MKDISPIHEGRKDKPMSWANSKNSVVKVSAKPDKEKKIPKQKSRIRKQSVLEFMSNNNLDVIEDIDSDGELVNLPSIKANKKNITEKK
jgi:hypothetical protein